MDEEKKTVEEVEEESLPEEPVESDEDSEEVEAETEETESVSEEESVSGEVTESEEQTQEREKEKRKNIFDMVEIITMSVVIVFILVSFVFRLASVNGTSMYPTLKNGEILLLSNLFYEPKTGDIIVFQQSNVETRLFDYPLVKRVIATEGQTIEFDFEHWKVKVDGVELEEDYINYIKEEYMRRLDIKENTIVVPEGYIFVMGDNRNNSTDSRDSRVSFIRKDEVLGKALLRLFPINVFGTIYGK